MSNFPPDPSEKNGLSAIEQKAAEWLVLRDRGLTRAQQQEFQAWRQADARHQEVYAELVEAWASFDRLRNPTPIAIKTCAGPNIAARGRGSRFRWIAGGLAAAAAITFAFVGWSSLHRNVDSYKTEAATEVGGMQKLILPDGSVIQLNTDTAVAVQFNAAERRVTLQHGEAHFHVAKNPAVPFIVSASGVAVRAVGTAFNVRMRNTAVEVLVTEGKVRVDDAVRGNTLLSRTRSGETPLLVAGQRAWLSIAPATAQISAARITPVAPPEIGQSLAWQTHRLEFVATPLAEMVAEFNRYNRHKLVIVDERLATQRFGGTFSAGDSEEFVRLLEADFGVVAERDEAEIRLRRKL